MNNGDQWIVTDDRPYRTDLIK